MIDKSFGEVLDEIIMVSKIKKSSLAGHLKYDASYISKWIRNVSLPSQKYVEILCQDIATFIVSNVNDDLLEVLCEHLGIENSHADKAFIIDYIKANLLDSFNKSHEQTLNLTVHHQEEKPMNSTTHIYPKNIGKNLVLELIQTMKSMPIDVIYVSDIGYLSDKMLYLELLDLFSKTSNVDKSKIRYIITNKNIDNNPVFTCIVLLYLVLSKPEFNHKIYVTQESIPFSVAIAKDLVSAISNYLSDDVCLSITVSREPEHVRALYSTYDQYISERCIPLFIKSAPQHFLQRKIFNDFLISNEIFLIMGTMNEMFFSPDMFSEISKSHFRPEEAAHLEEINTLLNNIAYKNPIRILLRKSEVIRFISTGEVHFFDKRIILTPTQRIQHMKHMISLFEKPNIEIKMIVKNILEKIPDSRNFTIYGSTNLVMSKSHVDQDIQNYFIVKDKKVQDSYKHMFNNLWQDHSGRINHDSSAVMASLIRMSEYAEHMK